MIALHADLLALFACAGCVAASLLEFLSLGINELLGDAGNVVENLVDLGVSLRRYVVWSAQRPVHLSHLKFLLLLRSLDFRW